MRLIACITLLLLTACASQNEEEQNEAEAVIVENLQIPWEMVKSGETFYMTEREGSIVKYKDERLDRQSILLNKPLITKGEGGMLGIELYPTFSNTKKAFVYHTYEENGSTLNRVIEVTENKTGWKETKEIISGIPGSLYHNGGRIKIGPDEKLYVTTGDATNPPLAQDKASLAGKILRLNLDGSIPKDNPIEGSYVYSYGHRNPQGLAWDEEGQLFASEHGDSAHDEINKITPGANYGWPVIEGEEEEEGMTTPMYESGKETWAPSGIVIKGRTLYAATLRGNEIRSFSLDDNESESFVDGYGRLRSLFLEEDSLYVITNNTDGRGKASRKDDRFLKVSLN